MLRWGASFSLRLGLWTPDHSQSSSSSRLLGFLGDAPFKRVLKVNFEATLPSCSVLMVKLSSKRS